MARKPLASRRAAGPSSIQSLLDSAKKEELVAVIGTGVSLGLTDGRIPSLSWKGLIENGFEYAMRKGRLSQVQFDQWGPQRQSDDIDELLSAAQFVSKRLKQAPVPLYDQWFQDVFRDIQPTSRPMVDAVCSLRDAGIPLCTLNYDSLLERATGLPTLTLSDSIRAQGWMRNETAGILHLHGSWESPEACILSIHDYQTTLTDDFRTLLQRSLGAFNRLLFVGCGGTFEDPNLSALISWLRLNMRNNLRHYALVLDSQVAEKHKDPAWQGFVEPIGFGAEHSDLSIFLSRHFGSIRCKAPKERLSSSRSAASTDPKLSLLTQYRSFLLKDCGQMSIDGVGADMETSRQRFDLERLFVPLKVTRVPPEIPASDPDREEKLKTW